jgi:hypothetical protein
VDHYSSLHTIPLPSPHPNQCCSNQNTSNLTRNGTQHWTGGGGIDVLLKFKGFVASVPRLLKLIVWKAMKGIFNLFELLSILEYQFCENHIAFSITCLLNCIGICNILTVLRLWSISLKCNTIQQCIINELILKDVSVGRVICRAIKPGLYAREKTHLSG